MENKKIEACIFDLDGVIVDTAKYHYLAWKRMANEMGFDLSEENNELLKGVSRMEALDIILEIASITKSDEEKEIMATKKNNWYVEYILTLTPDEILEGVVDFIEELKSLHVKLAIGSASKNAPMILDKLNLTKYFDVIIDGSKVSKAKPNPEVFLAGAKELDVSPSKCIVFEDAQAGIEAAQNAGMYKVGVGNAEILNKADFVISTFNGLKFNDLVNKLIKN